MNGRHLSGLATIRERLDAHGRLLAMAKVCHAAITPCGEAMAILDVEAEGLCLLTALSRFLDATGAKQIELLREQAAELRAAGVDEIWCVSVNDAFVMGAWGRDQKTAGKVRMMADGSADFARATGLTLDLTARGMGLRSNRYSMLVVDGVVKSLNVEAPGKFEVSDAGTMLRQARQLLA